MKKKLFDLGLPRYITIETEEESRILKVRGENLQTKDVTVEIAGNVNGRTVSVTAEDSKVRSIKLRWNTLLDKTSRILGSSWERTFGDAQWRGISGRAFMPWYFLAYCGGKTRGYGVKVRPSAMCFWQADTRGITLVLDTRCGGTGVVLKGRKLTAAEIICMEAEDCTSFQAAQAFCREMCSDHILPPYPVYGSNNWYYAYGDSSEKEILQDTDYLMELAEGAENPPYMVIDDCWQEHHRLNEYNGGPWRKGNAKFPDMAGLAEKIREKGARAGIWVRLLLNEDEKIPDEWRISHNGCLDPTHPEALAYIREDVETICRWGYTLLKHDFSTYDIFGRWGFEMNPYLTQDDWSFYDKGMTSAEAVKLLYQNIYETVSRYQTLIIGCNTIGHLGAGLMHMQRSGDDTSGITWERTRVMGVNTLAFCLPQQAKPGVLSEEEKEELHQIMLEASAGGKNYVPLDWEYTDCPEIWGEEKEKAEYNWYEEAGTCAKGNNILKYFAYIPLS